MQEKQIILSYGEEKNTTMKNTGDHEKAVAKKTPWWGWVFFALCLCLPLSTLGGAIPGALGVGGAAACLKISANDGITPKKRCAIIVALVWGTGWGVIYALRSI